MNPKLRKWVAIAFFVAVFIVLYLIRAVLMPFVISGIFVYLLAPVVDYMSKKTLFGWPISRGIGVVTVYILLFLAAGLLAIIVLPPLYQEVVNIANDLPNQVEEFRMVTLPAMMKQMEAWNQRFNLNVDIEHFFNQTLTGLIKAGETQIEHLAHHAGTVFEVLFSALSSFLVMFIVTAFVLVDLPRIKKGCLEMIPPDYRNTALALGQAIDKDLSGTIRGQLVICVINATLTTLGLLILQVKFAITIGLVAGVFSLIPVFGAVISTVPAVLIALTQSWVTALAVVGVIILIHLIEANFLNPKVLGHTVELHPSVIVFAIVVGEHFFGAAGLLFGVPVAAILRSILRYSYQQLFLVPNALALSEPESEAQADG